MLHQNFLKALLLLLTITCCSCSSMLYHPVQQQLYFPQQMGLKPEDVFFQSKNGARLHAWYFKSQNPKLKSPSQNPQPRGVIVFFHGNGENLSSHFMTLAWILQHGYDYLIFDYQGYGQSEGEPSPEKTVEDGIAAIQYVSTSAPGIPLIVFGQSLGGAVALRSVIELKNEVKIPLVAIDSSFSSYRQAGSHVLSHHWLTWLFQPFAYLFLSDTWAPEGRVKEISPSRLLVMHGTEDEIIDFELGEEIYDEGKAPKEFWKIEGGRHTDAFWLHKSKYRELFLEELSKLE